ncbi:uncharacterized protein [Blastocystis hominis]|uniref:Uncharacterized protein n=1 Tax=Blastocystis hominis TaxID=12968 RepID=D8M2J3_BLAHO|nr:uncharacterized protein [Blastocystis hominis]CBK22282.2 unnamed protein product [Blastocystis hominis]|eukprot:XP_012896330.1 uncharacterized protein [Blastocystis hominis]
MYREAAKCYSDAIDLDPSNHILYSNRAMAYCGLKEWAKAKEDGLKCVQMKPDFVKGYHRAATAMINLNEFIEAEELLQRGLKVFPDDKNLLVLLRIAEPKAEELRKEKIGGMPPLDRYKAEGNEHFKASRFTQAIQSYTKAIESVGENPPMSDVLLACYNNRAACYQQLGNYEAVVEDSTWVLEHDPKNIKALLRRGLAFENLERYRSALEDIRNVLMIDPTIAMANAAQHRIGDAVRKLKQEGMK